MELDDIIKGRELLIMQQKLHYEELCYYPGEPPGVFVFFYLVFTVLVSLYKKPNVCHSAF